MNFNQDIKLTIISLIFALSTYACGGSSSSSSDDTTGDDFTVETSVSRATVSNSSLSALTYGGSPSQIEVTGIAPKVGDEVQACDLDDNPLGEPCTTDAEGKCTITITAEEAAAGFVLKANGSSEINSKLLPELGMLIQPSGEDISLGTISRGLKPSSDLILALTKKFCDGDLASCKENQDLDFECMIDSFSSIIPDDPLATANETDDTLERQMGALLTSQIAASTKSGDEVPSLTDLMTQAFEGDPSGLANAGGNEIGDNKITMNDASTNVVALASKVKESYCTTSTDTGTSPWKDLKTSGGSTFNAKSVAGIMTSFSPDEFDEFSSESFKNYASSLLQLEGGFSIFKDDAARQTAYAMFKTGGFDGEDLENAIVTMGFMAATFPEPGDDGTIDFSGFNPGIAARAAYQCFANYTPGTGVGDPDDIFNTWKDTLTNTNNQLSFASGNNASIEMMSDWMSKYSSGDLSSFSAGEYSIEVPPGASCTSNDDCGPCHSCVSQKCEPISSKVGLTCNVSSDCDGSTSCVVGKYTDKGYCTCASVISEYQYVAGTTAGEIPSFYEVASSGSLGSACSSNSQCGSNLCTAGTCLPSDGSFKAGAGLACSTGTTCESGTCAGGFCSGYSNSQLETFKNNDSSEIGKTDIGGVCTTNFLCSSFNCVGGFCAAANTGSTSGTTTGGSTSGTTGGSTTTTTSGGTTGTTTTGGSTSGTTTGGSTTTGGTTGTTTGGTTTTSGGTVIGKFNGNFTVSNTAGTCTTGTIAISQPIAEQLATGSGYSFTPGFSNSCSINGNSCSSCFFNNTTKPYTLFFNNCSGACTQATLTKQ